jgi:hypothetical protein
VVFESGQLFDGNVVDDIALSRKKSRYPAGILFDSFENDLLDRRFVAPVIVVLVSTRLPSRCQLTNLYGPIPTGFCSADSLPRASIPALLRM